MTTPKLGRMEKVGLREAWANEASHFTPWLAKAENLTLLGEAIGRDLETHAEEHRVGPFRADLLCRETMSERWVLIENQLERTDHSHLGQLLTYAAGLSTVTVVWIAERFTDEHRAALDWLNQKTPEDISFFGLEVELWRIGDSLMAPKFNVVSKPNEWTRQITASTDISEVRQVCRDYWSGVIAEVLPSAILSGEPRPFVRQDMRFDVGWSQFFLKAYFSRVQKTKQGVWVRCRGPRGYEHFLALKDRKPEIEKAFGEELQWTPDEAKNEGSITHYVLGMNATDQSKWPQLHKVMADRIVRLYRAVKPFAEPLEGVEEDEEQE